MYTSSCASCPGTAEISPRPARVWPMALFAVLVCAAAATAQCGTQWMPDLGLAGANGYINATALWDPDGPGPAPEVVVVGGSFTLIGGVSANNIATYDPVSRTYASFGVGADNTVDALLAVNGDLIAAGWFSQIGGVAIGRVARYQGGTWLPVGSSNVTSLGPIRCLAAAPNGDLIVGGSFTTIGGVPQLNIARWSGTAWSPMGTNTGEFRALAIRPNGEIFAGGNFDNGSRFVRWTGSNWAPVGPPLNFAVESLLVHSSGDVFLGGAFTESIGIPFLRVARWNGTTLTQVGAGLGPVLWSDKVLGLLEEPNGDVVAVGATIAGPPILQRWNGATWSALVPTGAPLAGGASRIVRTAAGELIVVLSGGRSHLAHFVNGGWTPPAQLDGPVLAYATAGDGSLIAGGDFTVGGGASLPRIARYDGSSWQPLGSGTNGPVDAIDRLPNGDVVIAGSFTTAGGVAANRIARWDGAQWSSLNSFAYPVSGVDALAHTASNAILAAHTVPPTGFPPSSGRWQVSRLDGSGWTPIATTLFTDKIATLAVLPNGDLIAGGYFTTVGTISASRVARWNGVAWSPLGAGFDQPVLDLLVLPGGDLLAAGVFTVSGTVPTPGVARWDGTSWTPLGTGPGGTVSALLVLPNGDLLAGGALGGGQWLARWNGSSWSPLSSNSPGYVRALAMWPQDGVITSQEPAVGSSGVLGHVRELRSTCPALVQVGGSGCAGNLVSASLPWAGSTWHGEATGLPNAAVVFSVYGFATTSLPLSAVFATAQPGCTLHVHPDVVELAIATAGRTSARVVLPNTVALAGTVFHHQQVPFALDPTLAVTATNALILTVGVF